MTNPNVTTSNIIQRLRRENRQLWWAFALSSALAIVTATACATLLAA